MTEHTSLRADGYTGAIEFDGQSVSIQHNWRGSFGGWKAPHRIEIRRIREVSFAPASLMINGNITLVVPGETQIDGKTSKNIVMFTKKQQGAFSELHDALQAVMAEHSSIATDTEEFDSIDHVSTLRPLVYKQFVLGAGALGFNANGTRHVKPVAGSSATFDSGSERSRTTLTRVGAGTLLAGPIGAVGGALLKKNTSKCYVTVVFADGDSIIIEGPVRDEMKLREFATSVNQLARQ